MPIATVECLDTWQMAANVFGKIKKHQLSAKPSTFATLYEAEEGANGMSLVVSAVLEDASVPHQDKLDELHNLFIVPARLSERVYSLAEDLISQAQTVLNLIDSAAVEASNSHEALHGIQNKLRQPDRAELKGILSALIEHAMQMSDRGRNLLANFEASLRKLDVIQSDIATVQKQSRTDALTGLFTQRFFQRVLMKCIRDARLTKEPLCLVLADIDHFKQINDKYGHLVGDKVLSFFGAVVRESIKGQDFGARYGGEEFAVILPNTELSGAAVVAERIRQCVAQRKLIRRSTGQEIKGVTASMGVALLQEGEDSEAFFARADAHLYEAKALGRDRVVAQD